MPRIPPDAVLLAAAVAMWGIASVGPAPRGSVFLRAGVAATLAIAGIALSQLGGSAFRRAYTTTNPRTPDRATALVTTGVYRYTRNPMYLGMSMVLGGWAIFLESASSLVMLAAFVAFIDRFQIVPEERALALRFGGEYAAYRERVRRWL